MKKASSGKIKNATKLIVNGLNFKSKLEVFTYNKLLENGIVDFNYEGLKFTLLPNFEFNNLSIELGKNKSFAPVTEKIRSITYLPDFGNVNDDKTGWIMECKGYPNDAFPLKWKMFKYHLLTNGYNVKLYKPNNQRNVLLAIADIKSKYYV